MREYFIVFNTETGQELYRGSGPKGITYEQNLDENQGILEVPAEAVAGFPTNLDVIKTYYKTAIDQRAEDERNKYITSGSGQALTYIYKANEAREYLLDNNYPTPFMDEEVVARGISKIDLANEIITSVNEWTLIGSEIEGIRLGAKASIDSAINLLGILNSIINIEWPSDNE